MKHVLTAFLMLVASLQVVRGQAPDIDSLTKVLARTNEDTNRVLLLIEIAGNYQFFNSDTAMLLIAEALNLSRKLNFTEGEVRAISRQGEVRRIQGNFPQALEAELTAIKLSTKYNYSEAEAESLTFIAFIYLDLGEYRQALNYLFQAKKIYGKIAGQLSTGIAQNFPSFVLSNIGEAYEKLNMTDSAFYFQNLALRYPIDYGGHALALGRIGTIQTRLQRYNEALSNFRQVLTITDRSKDLLNRSSAQYQIAEIFSLQHNPDSAITYARLAFANAERSSMRTVLLDASSLLTKLYKIKGNLDSAFHYQQTAMNVKDSLFGLDKFRKLQLLTLSEQQRVQQLKEQQTLSKTRIQLVGLLLSVGVFLLIAFIFWRSSSQQKKANQLLNEKNLEIEAQSERVKKALQELKSTQAQLIQSEKMASLGELTAGIAHEIQNPLNFVNNFSDVNKELTDELEREIDNGNYAAAKAIARDIKGNEEKINHHGKRADAIVKSMLQHSRTTSGQKELTDINALADEYLRLAYHGLRAKDKTFNAKFETNFDSSIGKINIIPQEIGRVILNLINNAFYAVSEKAKLQSTLRGYEPQVIVQTKKISRTSDNDCVEIRVIDNGNGIPKNVVEKIFQPFFTTKPTGQGTGLGLSLAYDIAKAHGGEIKVESKERQGSEVIIHLPIIRI